MNGLSYRMQGPTACAICTWSTKSNLPPFCFTHINIIQSKRIHALQGLTLRRTDHLFQVAKRIWDDMRLAKRRQRRSLEQEDGQEARKPSTAQVAADLRQKWSVGRRDTETVHVLLHACMRLVAQSSWFLVGWKYSHVCFVAVGAIISVVDAFCVIF